MRLLLVIAALLCFSLCASGFDYKKKPELLKIYEQGKADAIALPDAKDISGDKVKVAALSTLHDDVMLPFNPWRALTLDRPIVWKVGAPKETKDMTDMKDEFYRWWKEVYPYSLDAKGEYTRPPTHKEGGNIHQKDCKYILKRPTKTGELVSFEKWAGECTGFEQLQFTHYYSGLLHGWLEKNKLIGGHLENQAEILFELSLNVDITPGYRARSGGWHVDATYTQARKEEPPKPNQNAQKDKKSQEKKFTYATGTGTKGACSPFHFVLTDKFPTLFFTKAIADFFTELQKQSLALHKCNQNQPFPGDSCEGHKMLMEAIGDTYQESSHHVVPHKGKSTHVWLYDTTKGEPLPQFTQGYLNQQILDGCTRPFGVDAVNVNVEEEEKPLKADIEIIAKDKTVKYKSTPYVFGEEDNPKGANFRKYVDSLKNAKALKEGAVVEAAAPWEMAVMEGYRLHNAGSYPKKLTSADDPYIKSLFGLKSTERFFVRIAVLPRDCISSDRKFYAKSQQTAALRSQIQQKGKQKTTKFFELVERLRTCGGAVCLEDQVVKDVLHTD